MTKRAGAATPLPASTVEVSVSHRAPALASLMARTPLRTKDTPRTTTGTNKTMLPGHGMGHATPCIAVIPTIAHARQMLPFRMSFSAHSRNHAAASGCRAFNEAIAYDPLIVRDAKSYPQSQRMAPCGLIRRQRGHTIALSADSLLGIP